MKLLPDFDFLKESVFGPPTIWPNEFAVYTIGEYEVDGNEVATLISTGAAVLLLTALFRYTTIGLADAGGRREPADDRAGRHQRRPGQRLLVDAVERVRGLAGVLLAPLFAQVAAPTSSSC